MPFGVQVQVLSRAPSIFTISNEVFSWELRRRIGEQLFIELLLFAQTYDRI